MTKIETLKKQLQERQKIIRNKIDLYNNQKEKIINDLRALNFYSDYEIQENEKVNKQNYRKLETGQNAIHGAFEVSTNWWSGKRSYNENK